MPLTCCKPGLRYCVFWVTHFAGSRGLGGVVLNEQNTFDGYSLHCWVKLADFNQIVLYPKG